MKFKVSENYKRRDRRNAVLAALLVVIIFLGCIWMLISSDSLFNKGIAALTAFLMGRYLPAAYRRVVMGEASYPEVEISELDNEIRIKHNDTTISMPLSDIEKLIIQKLKGKVTSILLTNESFSDLRFEGYEQLEQMASLLQKHNPNAKSKTANWYHR